MQSNANARLAEHPDSNIIISHTESRGRLKRPRSVHDSSRPTVKTFQEQLKEIAVRASQLKTEFESVTNTKNTSFEQHLWCVLLELRSYLFLSSPSHVIDLLVPHPDRTRLYQTKDISRNLRHTRLASCVYMAVALMTVTTPNATLHAVLTLLSLLPLFTNFSYANSVHTKRYFDTISFLLRALFANDRERFWELSRKLLSSSCSSTITRSSESSSLERQTSTNTLESFIIQATIANKINDKLFVFELIPHSFSSLLSNTSIASSSSLLSLSENQGIAKDCNLDNINNDNENTNHLPSGKTKVAKTREMSNVLSCLFTCAITAESMHEQVCTLYGATWLFDELLDITRSTTAATIISNNSDNFANTFCYWSDANITTMTCIACSLLAIKLEANQKDVQSHFLPQNKMSPESTTTNVDNAISVTVNDINDNRVVANDSVSENEHEQGKLMCACGRLLSRLYELNLLVIHVHGPIILYSLLSRWISYENVNNSNNISNTNTCSKFPEIYKWEEKILEWIVNAVDVTKKSTWLYLVTDDLVSLALQNFVKLNQEMYYSTRSKRKGNSFDNCEISGDNEDGNECKSIITACKNTCEEHDTHKNAITFIMSSLSHYLYMVIHKYQLLSSRQLWRITEPVIMQNNLRELLTLQDRASLEQWFISGQHSYLHSFTHELFTFLPFEYSFSLLQRVIQESLAQEVSDVCENEAFVHLSVNALVALFCCSEQHFCTVECEEYIMKGKIKVEHDNDKDANINTVNRQTLLNSNDRLKIITWLQLTSNKLLISLQQLLINNQCKECVKCNCENELTCEEFVLEHIAALLYCSKRCGLEQQTIEKCFDILDVIVASNVRTESNNRINVKENGYRTRTWEMFLAALSSYVRSKDKEGMWIMRVLRIIRKLSITFNQQLLAMSMTMLAECYTQEIVNILICNQEHHGTTVHEAVLAHNEKEPEVELEEKSEDNKSKGTHTNNKLSISRVELVELMISALSTLVKNIDSKTIIQVENIVRECKEIFEMFKVIMLCLCSSKWQLESRKLEKTNVEEISTADNINNDNEEESIMYTSKCHKQNDRDDMNEQKDTIWHVNKCQMLELLNWCDVLHKAMCDNVEYCAENVTANTAADELMCTICLLCILCWQEIEYQQQFTTKTTENTMNTKTECSNEVSKLGISKIVQNVMSRLFDNAIAHKVSCYHYLSFLLHTVYCESNNVITAVIGNAKNMSTLQHFDNVNSLQNMTQLVQQTVKWIWEKNRTDSESNHENSNDETSQIARSINKLYFINNLCCGHWREGICADVGEYIGNTTLYLTKWTFLTKELTCRRQQVFFLDVCAQFWKSTDYNNNSLISLQSIVLELAYDTLCSMNMCVEEYVRMHPKVITSTPAFFAALCNMSETDTAEVVTQTLDLLLMPTICHECNMSELLGNNGDSSNLESSKDEEVNVKNVNGLSVIQSFLHTSNVNSIAFAPALANILFYSHYKRLNKVNNNTSNHKEAGESSVSTKNYVERVIKMMELMMSKVVGCDSVNSIPELVHKHLAAIVLCLLSLYTDMESQWVNAISAENNNVTSKADVNKCLCSDMQTVSDGNKGNVSKSANNILIVDVDVDVDEDSSNKSVMNESRSITETPKYKRDNTTKVKGKVSAKRGRKKSLKANNDVDDDDDDNAINNEDAEHLEVNSNKCDVSSPIGKMTANNISEINNLYCKALFNAICDVASLQESQPTRSAIARALRLPMEENLAAHVIVKALFDILDRLNTLMHVKYLQSINDSANNNNTNGSSGGISCQNEYNINKEDDQKWTKYKSLCSFRVQRGLSGLVQLILFLRERSTLMAAKLPAMLEYCCVSPETTLNVCKVWEALVQNCTDAYLREHAPTIVIDLVSLEMRCCQTDMNNNKKKKELIVKNANNQVEFCENNRTTKIQRTTQCLENKEEHNMHEEGNDLDKGKEQMLHLLHRTLTFLYWKTHDLSFWAPYLIVLSQSSELVHKLWQAATSLSKEVEESALLDTVNPIVRAKNCNNAHNSSDNIGGMQQKSTRLGAQSNLAAVNYNKNKEVSHNNDDNHHVASMIAGFMAVMHSCSSKCKSVFVRCFYSYLHSASVERRLELTHSASVTPELVLTLLACARELKCNEDVELALKCVGMLAAIAPRLSLSPSAQAVYGCENETDNHNSNKDNNVNKMVATNTIDPTPLSIAALMSDSISYGNRTNNNSLISHMSENMFVNLELVLDWRKLAHTLLEVYCPRALSNTADPVMHDRAAYAIQELLRVFTNAERQSCDGIPLRTRQSVSSDELQRYVWWKELHVSVQQLLSGFTTTTYATWVAQQTERKTPEYEPGMPYSQWVFALFRNLGSRCRLVIGDCVLALRNVAKRDHILTNFLLPYMLLHIIVNGSAEDKADVITEINTVFIAAASHASLSSSSELEKLENKTLMHKEISDITEEPTRNRVAQSRGTTEAKLAQSTWSHTHSIDEHVQLLLHLLENIEHFCWDLLRVLRTGKEPHSTAITKPSISSSSGNGSSHNASDEFKCAELLECCHNFMEHVDWRLRVRAAMSIGSNMRALRIIETQRRLPNVHMVMSAIPLQHLFATLDDRDSAKCIHRLSSSMTAVDAARSLENTGDWQLALQQCELVLEQDPHRVEHQLIALRCLQKLGQLHLMSRYATAVLSRPIPTFHSFKHYNNLNNCMYNWDNDKTSEEPQNAYEQVRSYANEAAWRLGQWDEVYTEDSHASFNLAGPLTTFIRALHGEESMCSVLEMTRVERAKVMPCLRTTCREGYAQAYPFIAMLHALADLDDVAEILEFEEHHWQQCEELEEPIESTPCWKNRRSNYEERKQNEWQEHHSISVSEHVLRQVTKSLEQRLQYTEDTLDAREPLLSLHRVIYTALGAHHSASETRLQHAQVLRNSGLMHAALNTIQQMSEEERIRHPTYFTMVAELLHDMYSPMEAIEFAQRQCCNEALPRTTRAMLQLHVTNWTQAIGSQTPKEVIACYEEVLTLHHSSEEAHHCLGMFYDKLYHIHMESAEVSRQAVNASDRVAVQKGNAEIVEKIRIFAVNAATHFGKALLIGTQTLSTSLPRLLTLWLDSTSRLVSLQVESNTNNVYVERVIKLMNGIIENFTLASKSNCIPVYVLITALPQLLSRLCHPCADVVTLLTRIVVHLMNHFPQPCLWSVMPIAFSKQGERVQIATQRLITPFAEFSKANMSNFENAYKLFECLIKLCNCSDKSLGNGSKLLEQPFMQRIADKLETAHFIVPTLANLTPNIHVMDVCTESTTDRVSEIEHDSVNISISSSSSTKANKDKQRKVDNALEKVFPNSPTFARFEDKVEVMNSLQRPKRIWVQTNEGSTVSFLCKSKDEPRKDIRMMEVAGLLNTLFRSDPVARRKRFALRRYSIAALNDDCAMIEWVNDISTLRSVVMQTYALDNTGVRLSRVKEWYSKVTNKLMTKMELFTKHILPASPPVLHQWFALHFSNHQSWYVARTLFTQSIALWSISGHLLGLGDRHSDNLMLDLKCGEMMHVDFACLFDKGETLEVPERVRFRLTQNLTDAMGVLKADGPFRNYCETALRCNMKSKNAVMSVVETLLHDPLVEWIGRGNQGRGVNVNASATTNNTNNNNNNNNNKNNDSAAAVAADISSRRRVINPKSLINRVARRLDGFLDLYTVPPEPDSLALNVEGQVTKLINHSSSLENLS